MWWILSVVIVIIAVGLFMAMRVDGPNRKEASRLQFENVQFSNLKDGTYIGQRKGSTSHLRDTETEMRVAGGEVEGFRILKGAAAKNGQPVKLSKGRTIDELFKAAIEAKNLGMDVISGVTVTSKTHLKAFGMHRNRLRSEKQ